MSGAARDLPTADDEVIEHPDVDECERLVKPLRDAEKPAAAADARAHSRGQTPHIWPPVTTTTKRSTVPDVPALGIHLVRGRSSP